MPLIAFRLPPTNRKLLTTGKNQQVTNNDAEAVTEPFMPLILVHLEKKCSCCDASQT